MKLASQANIFLSMPHNIMPYIILLDGKAYLVGVFSRGDECGSFNQPGIYTSTLEYIDWIVDNSKEEEC